MTVSDWISLAGIVFSFIWPAVAGLGTLYVSARILDYRMAAAEKRLDGVEDRQRVTEDKLAGMLGEISERLARIEGRLEKRT